MPDRIERNVIIARSGVYPYREWELKNNTSLDPKKNGPAVYYVYRPAVVLAKNKDKYTKLPLTKEHPPGFVTKDNFKEYTIGWSGDTADIVMMEGSDEIGIQSICQLLDDEALTYYDNGVRDVSPGYVAHFEWAEGKTVDGEHYDIIMTDVYEVNHLAFTQRGRGGQGVAMDSALTLADLAYYTNKMTTDSDLPSFRQMIEDIVSYRGEYEEDEIKIGVMELLKLCDTMPECEDKVILQRIIKDFYNVKNAFNSDEAAKVAADLVAGRYESLDSKIMEDSAMLFKKGKVKDADPIPAEKEEAPPAAEAPAAEAPEPLPEDKPAAPPADANAAPPAPAAPDAAQAGSAPIQAAVMEVSQMPDDLSAIDDATLLAVLNGLVKFAKAIAPGEAQEPQHQEPAPAAPPAQDSEVESEEMAEDNLGEEMKTEGGDQVGGDVNPENQRAKAMDSIFRMPMGRDNKNTKGLADFAAQFKKKGAK